MAEDDGREDISRRDLLVRAGRFSLAVIGLALAPRLAGCGDEEAAPDAQPDARRPSDARPDGDSFGPHAVDGTSVETPLGEAHVFAAGGDRRPA